MFYSNFKIPRKLILNPQPFLSFVPLVTIAVAEKKSDLNNKYIQHEDRSKTVAGEKVGGEGGYKVPSDSIRRPRPHTTHREATAFHHHRHHHSYHAQHNNRELE